MPTSVQPKQSKDKAPPYPLLVVEEAEFIEFARLCRERGFDLSYAGTPVSGSRKELERLRYDGPRVIRTRRRRCGLDGTPYSVAEWQRQAWAEEFPRLVEEFGRKMDRGVSPSGT